MLADWLWNVKVLSRFSSFRQLDFAEKWMSSFGSSRCLTFQVFHGHTKISFFRKKLSVRQSPTVLPHGLNRYPSQRCRFSPFPLFVTFDFPYIFPYVNKRFKNGFLLHFFKNIAYRRAATWKMNTVGNKVALTNFILSLFLKICVSGANLLWINRQLLISSYTGHSVD